MFDTVIPYMIPTRTRVRVVAFNARGRKLSTLVDEIQAPGRHNAQLTGENLPSGLYICVLQAGSRVATRKLVLLK